MIWRLGVAGYPIEHSMSPQLHEAGLRMAGLEGNSTRLALKPDEVPRLRSLLGTTYDALSVTMPLKAAVIGICDELDEVASRLGVANSLLFDGDRILGANTDGQGFVNALHDGFSTDVAGTHAVVLGAGGAALGIVDALVQAGVGSVSILSRTPSKAEELASRYENVVAFVPELRPVDVIVNTTPATARSEATVTPGVRASTIAIDITYEPRRSAWLELHERLGCPSANGLSMLAHQAALQMTWWWKVPIDAVKLLEVIE
jgi:shikimate dehydrogenase